MNPRTLAVKRHRLHPSGVQKAVTAAVRAAGITQRTAHTLRAAFAHRLKAGYQLDDIQKRTRNTTWKAKPLPTSVCAGRYPPNAESPHR